MPGVARKPKGLAELRDKMSQTWGDRVTRQGEISNQYEVISSGSLTLDVATRIGGFPRGRIVEIAGIEGVGKTTLVANSAAAHQAALPALGVGYIDMEQTWDWSWAAKQGVNTDEDRFLHVFPDNSEDVADQIKSMMLSGLFSLIIVDSIGGMESQKAFDKDAGESNMGKNAQIISRMTKLVASVSRQSKTTAIFINQYRANFNDPTGRVGDVSAGPKILKYASTMKIDMRRGGEPQLKVKVDGQDEVVGHQVRARVSRSKVGPQGRTAEFWLINQETDQFGPVGIDKADEAMSIGLATHVVEQQGGGYYLLPDGTRERGRETLLGRFRSEPDLVSRVRELAIATTRGEAKPEEPDTAEETLVEVPV